MNAHEAQTVYNAAQAEHRRARIAITVTDARRERRADAADKRAYQMALYAVIDAREELDAWPRCQRVQR